MINTIFDKTYLINLDRRTDRLAGITQLTEQFDFEFTRVSAVDGETLVEGENGVPVFTDDQKTYLRFNKNSYALNLTVINILKEAIKKKYKSILICEDDLRFKENYFDVREEEAVRNFLLATSSYEKNKIYNCDCIEKLKETNSKIIDLTILDPPYYKVVSEKWDNEWKTQEEFLSWFENIIIEVSRVSKNNSALYLFGYWKILYKQIPI